MAERVANALAWLVEAAGAEIVGTATLFALVSIRAWYRNHTAPSKKIPNLGTRPVQAVGFSGTGYPLTITF